MSTTSRTIERDGARIAYDVAGQGPAVVLGHSLLCGRWMWRDIAPALATSHTVINIEVRGHGESTAPRPFSFADLVADWAAILDREGIDRAALVGLSMGGMTAMRFALAFPDRVAKLALLDSNADRERLAKRAQYGVLVWLYRRLGMRRPLADRVAPIMLGATTLRERPELVRDLIDQVARHDREPLIRAIRCVVDRADEPPIERIGAPALILVGEEDRATPPALSEKMHRRMPGSKLVRIPGAGHLSAFERPDAVLAHLAPFLAA